MHVSEQDAVAHPTSTDTLITALWQRAQGDLSRSELECYSGASEEAGHMVCGLQKLIDDVGCLVLEDERAGNFKEGDTVSNFLFTIAQSLGTIQGMLTIGAAAAYKLQNMRKSTPGST